jgi:hypothetical protein
MEDTGNRAQQPATMRKVKWAVPSPREDEETSVTWQ